MNNKNIIFIMICVGLMLISVLVKIIIMDNEIQKLKDNLLKSVYIMQDDKDGTITKVYRLYDRRSVK